MSAALSDTATVNAARGARPAFDDIVHHDVVIVGSGVAGLTVALGCAPRSAALLTKAAKLGTGGSSVWAQGGVAAALGEDDSPELHAADTLAAGAGLCDPEVVGLLVREGCDRVRHLIELGALFDRDADGRLVLGREAAHGRHRILHANGDATGAELVRTLAEAVRRAPEVEIFEGAEALDLVVRDKRVVGVVALHGDGRRRLHQARAVVLATGGIGQLYERTTNPAENTGDGLAMAARAGALLVDLEMVQFHPTALAVPANGSQPATQMALITEALRGAGAILVDGTGTRFMVDHHPDAELAPRDVVARAIWRRLQDGDEVFLDARQAVGDDFPHRFPTVFDLCIQRGIDPRQQPIPVSPAAHYHMGGVAVGSRGRSSAAGLWACGEVASSGAHGANRLASNSLLEAMVFGARVAADLRRNLPPRWHGPLGLDTTPPVTEADRRRTAAMGAEIRRLLWEKVGLIRDDVGLLGALARLDQFAAVHPEISGEVANLLTVARLIAAAALHRRESRGSHWRSDYPHQDPAWRRRLFLRLDASDVACFEPAPGESTAQTRVAPPLRALG